VPAVLAALEAAGLGAAEVTIARPSLDDVYLRHTGRAFADAGEADRVESRRLEEARS
jgi:ABC-2 type transport system ATP-binding protein